MDEQLWLVVGLGNPGDRYRDTRHNIGFMVVEALGKEMVWQSSNRFAAHYTKGELSKRKLVLAKPQTFMNLSGESVGPLARFYNIPAEMVIAVHDDVDLEPGRLKIKAGGGDGGHKGVRSMAQWLGNEFYRVRCGIGRPPVGEVVAFVLRDFSTEEQEALDKQIERAAKAVRCLMTRGLKETMNRFNRPLKKPKKNKEDNNKSEKEDNKTH